MNSQPQLRNDKYIMIQIIQLERARKFIQNDISQWIKQIKEFLAELVRFKVYQK